MNFSSKKLTINAVSAVVQVVFTALLYFFLYKYLLKSIGIEQLGVWSLILSFSSIANLANLGLTSGLVKFVAEYLTENDNTKLGKLIFTSTLSMVVLFVVLSLIILFGAQFFLEYIIDENFLDTALEILPYSLASLCINAVGGVFTSVLEGHQKNYIRNFIYIISGIIMFAATALLTPVYHLKGVAIAQLLQSVFIFVTALVFTIRINPDNKIRYWKWSSQSFKELFNYGYKFQMVSVAQLLCEPTTKVLLSKFGGLAFVGHYEMASKAVNQFRALLVNANQIVIPVIVENAKIKTEGESQKFYQMMNRVLAIFTLPLSSLLILGIPFISIFWVGSFNIEFAVSMLILSMSSVINILCSPAYFSCLAEGRLTILVFVHSIMAILNLILGYLLGLFFEGYGVAFAWGISVSIASVILIYSYGKKIRLNYFNIFSINYRLQFLLFLLISLICVAVFLSVYIPKNEISAIILVLIILLYIPLLLKNEIIKRLMKKLDFSTKTIIKRKR
ncbi:oligosaccharide flippase family protein [Chryseobacterium formosus]|uniref:Oligosaccharide flippase family protein n=1 Tax=Chryseobacterium formosus TaxID=1537363 RepID=A0ABT3XN57_9FLAO|nr:oligosaccharide flippase family protein [Chryseobacterium formosus]MCX8523559.1 oligosaccharide flippase family protein [Chryseobacterium formosus]